MNKSAAAILAAGLLLAAAGLSPALADDAPRGMTMRIQQDHLLGGGSATVRLPRLLPAAGPVPRGRDQAPERRWIPT